MRGRGYICLRIACASVRVCWSRERSVHLALSRSAKQPMPTLTIRRIGESPSRRVLATSACKPASTCRLPLTSDHFYPKSPIPATLRILRPCRRGFSQTPQNGPPVRREIRLLPIKANTQTGDVTTKLPHHIGNVQALSRAARRVIVCTSSFREISTSPERRSLARPVTKR